MRRSSPRIGLTLRNLLQIGFLCAVIGGVPALATGVRQAHAAMRAMLGADTLQATSVQPAQSSTQPGPPLMSGDAPIMDAMHLSTGLLRLASWCQTGPDGIRLCRV